MMIAVAMAMVVVITAVVALFVNATAHPERAAAPLDTERTERWLVSHAPSGLRRPLGVVDRKVVGGVATVAVLAIVFVVALIVGWTLDTVDRNRGFARWDRSAAVFGHTHATSTSTAVLRAVTQLGATGWLALVMAAIAAVAFVRHRRWDEAAYLALIVGGVSLLNNSLKWAVGRERPDIGALTSHSGSSFPSGHAAAAAACWAGIALVCTRRRSRPIRAVAASAVAVIGVAVAASRVLLGVHWLTDVIAGLFTGWGWFLVVTVVFGGRLLSFGEPADRISGSAPAARPIDILTGSQGATGSHRSNGEHHGN